MVNGGGIDPYSLNHFRCKAGFPIVFKLLEDHSAIESVLDETNQNKLNAATSGVQFFCVLFQGKRFDLTHSFSNSVYDSQHTAVVSVLFSCW